MILIAGGRCTAAGPKDAVLRPAVLEPVYGVRFETADIDGVTAPIAAARLL